MRTTSAGPTFSKPPLVDVSSPRTTRPVTSDVQYVINTTPNPTPKICSHCGSAIPRSSSPRAARLSPRIQAVVSRNSSSSSEPNDFDWMELQAEVKILRTRLVELQEEKNRLAKKNLELELSLSKCESTYHQTENRLQINLQEEEASSNTSVLKVSAIEKAPSSTTPSKWKSIRTYSLDEPPPTRVPRTIKLQKQKKLQNSALASPNRYWDAHDINNSFSSGAIERVVFHSQNPVFLLKEDQPAQIPFTSLSTYITIRLNEAKKEDPLPLDKSSSTGGLTAKRMAIACNLFDTTIMVCNEHREALRMLREELLLGIYAVSPESLDAEGKVDYLKCVPYFQSNRRLKKENIEMNDLVVKLKNLARVVPYGKLPPQILGDPWFLFSRVVPKLQSRETRLFFHIWADYVLMATERRFYIVKGHIELQNWKCMSKAFSVMSHRHWTKKRDIAKKNMASSFGMETAEWSSKLQASQKLSLEYSNKIQELQKQVNQLQSLDAVNGKAAVSMWRNFGRLLLIQWTQQLKSMAFHSAETYNDARTLLQDDEALIQLNDLTIEDLLIKWVRCVCGISCSNLNDSLYNLVTISKIFQQVLPKELLVQGDILPSDPSILNEDIHARATFVSKAAIATKLVSESVGQSILEARLTKFFSNLEAAGEDWDDKSSTHTASPRASSYSNKKDLAADLLQNESETRTPRNKTLTSRGSFSRGRWTGGSLTGDKNNSAKAVKDSIHAQLVASAFMRFPGLSNGAAEKEELKVVSERIQLQWKLIMEQPAGEHLIDSLQMLCQLLASGWSELFQNVQEKIVADSAYNALKWKVSSWLLGELNAERRTMSFIDNHIKTTAELALPAATSSLSRKSIPAAGLTRGQSFSILTGTQNMTLSLP